MPKKKNYHQPILEKKYTRILSALESLDAHYSNTSSIFSRVISRIKKVLFYELPVEIIIEEKPKAKKETEIKQNTIEKEKKSNVA